MRPFVASVAKFTHKAPFTVSECFPEDLVPVIPHEAEQCGDVEVWGVIIGPVEIMLPAFGCCGDPVCAEFATQFSFHEGFETGEEEFQGFTDAIVVCESHF